MSREPQPAPIGRGTGVTPVGRPAFLVTGVALVLLLVLAWGGGFGWFVWRATRPAVVPARADGIVALTGGAGRIDAALTLLAGDHARLMLISGVQPSLDLDAVMRGATPGASGRRAAALLADPALRDRITLGHVATTTLGNAVETAAWARANGLHRLIVVTAGYHMSRALREIGAALPEAELLPYPVLPPALRHPTTLHTLRLLVFEYDKWLLVASGLAGTAHLGETA